MSYKVKDNEFQLKDIDFTREFNKKRLQKVSQTTQALWGLTLQYYI